MRYLIICLTVPILLSLAGSPVWGQGYVLQDNTLVVGRKEHWESWTFPKGALEVSEEGGVRPIFVRKHINAVLDAAAFIHPLDKRFLEEFPFWEPSEGWVGMSRNVPIAAGGIKDAGSNREDASNIIDGEPDSFWQPNMKDPVEDWWVEIDLGRLISATKIVIRFVEEEIGDPFAGFRVLTSRGAEAYWESHAVGWRQTFRTRERDRGTRIFEIVPEPESPSEFEGQGDEIQYVRIQAMDLEDRGKEVTREEYTALAPELRGAKEYYKRTRFGEERPISEEAYQALSLDQRGRIRYYRRHLPRLAEVEVWTLGDNIALDTRSRGGFIESLGVDWGLFHHNILDGSYLTVGVLYEYERKQGVFIDLGATFWVDTVHIIASDEEWYSHIPNYQIEGSDGTLGPGGDILWNVLTSESRLSLDSNVDLKTRQGYRLRRTEDVLDLCRTRFLRLQFFPSWRGVPVHLRELEVYGEGYVSDVTLESPRIRLGMKGLSSIHWEGESPPDTKLEIRTRTGNTLKEEKHYYDRNKRELTAREWARLPSLFKEPEEIRYVPGDDWSVWSHPYNRPGEFIASPSPRKYLQIQVGLLSEDPNQYASIHSLSIGYFTPLVQQVVGEIHPFRISRPGVSQLFSLFLEFDFLPSNLGFDGVLIRCPYKADMQFVGINVGREEDFLRRTQEALSLGDLSVVARSDSLWIRFPERIKPVQRDVMEIRFEATLFLTGVPFDVFLFNAEMPGSPQRVDTGDALSSVDSQTMRVMVPVDRRVIGDVSVSPNPFTPNGDGINDQASIQFSIFNADVSRAVNIQVFDLGGDVVRGLSDRRGDISGRHTISWDGREDSGRMVSPGIYLVRISVDAESDTALDTRMCRPVCVVY